MKQYTTRLLLTAFIGLALPTFAQSDLKDDLAYLPIDETIDVKIAKPEVTVNLPKFLLNNALSEFDGGPEDPFAKAGIDIGDIVKDIKLIRVMVIEATDANRDHVAAGVRKLRGRLDADWIALVSVPEEGIGIYTRSDASGEKMAGLAMLMSDGEDTIVGNIVGNVPIGKIAKLAATMGTNNEELKKLLGQLMGGQAAGATETGSAEAK